MTMTGMECRDNGRERQPALDCETLRDLARTSVGKRKGKTSGQGLMEEKNSRGGSTLTLGHDRAMTGTGSMGHTPTVV